VSAQSNLQPSTSNLQQPQHRRRLHTEWIVIESTSFEPCKPCLDQLQHAREIQMFVDGRIFGEIGVREFEQRGGRTQSLLLKMHESARQLDESFVEITIRPAPVREPEFFEDIVRFVKFLPVETIEVAEIVRAQRATLKGCDSLGDLSALFTHSAINGNSRGLTQGQFLVSDSPFNMIA
jgi:hypothetical protein